MSTSFGSVLTVKQTSCCCTKRKGWKPKKNKYCVAFLSTSKTHFCRLERVAARGDEEESTSRPRLWEMSCCYLFVPSAFKTNKQTRRSSVRIKEMFCCGEQEHVHSPSPSPSAPSIADRCVISVPTLCALNYTLDGSEDLIFF